MADKFFKHKVIVDVDEEETSRMRETWFQHIFTNIEKLATDLYSSKENLNNKLAKIREEHYVLKDELKVYVDAALEKLRIDLKEDLHMLGNEIASINTYLKSLEGKLSDTEIKRLSEAQVVAEQIEAKLKNIKQDMDDKVERQLTPVTREVWINRGKVIAWATILSVIFSGIISYLIRHF